MIDAKELADVLGEEAANKLLGLIQTKRRERITLSDKDRDTAIAYLNGRRGKGVGASLNKALRWWIQFDGPKQDFRNALTGDRTVESLGAAASAMEALERSVDASPPARREPRRGSTTGSSLFTPR